MNKQELALEAKTIYIVAKYFECNLIKAEVIKDYICNVHDMNVDLAPELIRDHCEFLKNNPDRLRCHYPSTFSDKFYIVSLDQIMKELGQ